MSLLDTASLVVTPNGTKASKLYSVVPSSGAGDLSVTRATTATRVNSSGLIESVASNVPRLDYTNGSCPSILVEPQRTNMLSFSEQFENSFWTKGNSTITVNAINSPSGTLTADKLVENTANNGHYAETVIATSAGQTYTLTVFLKKAERNFAYIGAYTNESKQVYVNLTTGAVTTTAGTILNYNVQSLVNGWFRVSLTFTATTEVYPFFGASNNGTNFSYTGDGTSGIYIWGAQLEAGSYATSYIPTTSASVTRNADVISKTGISSLIGQTEGTLFLDFVFKTPPSTTDGQLAISSSSASDRVIIWNNFTLNTLALQIRANGSNVISNVSLGSFVDGTRYKIAIAYKSGSTSAYVNGSQIISNSSTFTFSSSVADFILGSYEIGYQGHQKNNLSALWKTRLTNTQLAQLTTI